MNKKNIVWIVVIIVPLLYEFSRRIAPPEWYLGIAFVLHWGLALTAILWLKAYWENSEKLALKNPLKRFLTFVTVIIICGASVNLVLGDLPLEDWQWAQPGMSQFGRWGYLIAPVTAGFCEEVIYRGFMMNGLKKAGYPILLAMVASSISFVLFHGFTLPIPFLVGGFIISMIWAGIFQWTSNLWVTIFIHGLWDIAATLVPWKALF